MQAVGAQLPAALHASLRHSITHHHCDIELCVLLPLPPPPMPHCTTAAMPMQPRKEMQPLLAVRPTRIALPPLAEISDLRHATENCIQLPPCTAMPAPHAALHQRPYVCQCGPSKEITTSSQDQACSATCKKEQQQRPRQRQPYLCVHTHASQATALHDMCVGCLFGNMPTAG